MIDVILKNKAKDQVVRIRAEISGRVQGVGFRPLVYRYATQAGLNGFVNNTSTGVLLEVQGTMERLTFFFKHLEKSPPRSAHIDSMQLREVGLIRESGFLIAMSQKTGETLPAFPPDLATCPDCKRDILQARNRRYGYALTNCIQCGPRFTIIQDLPYDRERTSMQRFEMCEQCQAEYSNVQDRRFHAQPNACARCGPQLSFLGTDKQPVDGPPLENAQDLIKQGKILALKGIGGYHLACDATNGETIAILRKRKHRPHKAFAVMVSDEQEIKNYCTCTPEEETLLKDPAAPIVLLSKRTDCMLPKELAPDTSELGLFLPSTPLHHLLLKGLPPLVMTSGNLAEEPIVKDEDELESILGTVADGALVHDRPIVRRCDDSVMRVIDQSPTMLRRSRGFVPEPLELPFDGPSLFAAGADLKNTFCLTKGRWAFLSQYIGDLSDSRTYDFYRDQIKDFRTLLDIHEDIGVCDMHPQYRSSHTVRDFQYKHIVEVQHHHAHIASAMVENNLNEKVLGIALDGTGYGPDNTIWGGEILLADYAGYKRLARFSPVSMPGGDQAIHHPQRMALAYLYTYLKEDGLEAAKQRLSSIRADDRAMLTTMLEQGVRAPLTSSAGRLFDAVAGLMGMHDPITYEAQAAIGLQFLWDASEKQSYDALLEQQGDLLVFSFEKMLRQILVDISSGIVRERISAKFHHMLAETLCTACQRLKVTTQVNTVVLSGGVFQNHFLLQELRQNLEQAGFTVCVNRLVPTNDGGIALGQAAIALAQFQKS